MSDGRVCVTRVSEAGGQVIQVLLLASSRNSGDAFDLRCIVRGRMIGFLARGHPAALPRPPRGEPADIRSPGAEDGAP